MGTYYFYGNRTKQEWFLIDPSKRDIKQYGIGQGIGARCLSLLLLEHDPHHSTFKDHPRIGSWIGDEVFVAGDDSTQEFESEIVQRWRDVAHEMLEMLSVVDPYAFLSHGGHSWLLGYARSGDMPAAIRRTLLRTFRSIRSSDPDGTDMNLELIDALRPPTETAPDGKL